MTNTQIIIKRSFDFSASFIGVLIVWPVILLAWLFASIDTKSNGLFKQTRVGKDAKLFTVYKIKTMSNSKQSRSTVAGMNQAEITRLGAHFRRFKIDELPQLVNVLFGQMSFVGPRPDVPGYADKLQGDEREMLLLRPGITGPASLKYKDEEYILARQENPQEYNDKVLWPDKVLINIDYINNYSFKNDLKYIFQTILG